MYLAVFNVVSFNPVYFSRMIPNTPMLGTSHALLTRSVRLIASDFKIIIILFPRENTATACYVVAVLVEMRSGCLSALQPRLGSGRISDRDVSALCHR